MKRITWIVAALGLAGGLAYRGTGCASAAPDEQLAANLRATCEIARDNLETPAPGVRKLMRYYGEHGPEMLEQLGATLVAIERIDDDDAHDARARVTRDRLHAMLDECGDTWQRFDDAVNRDPEASKLLARGFERLGRTLEIILQSDRADGRGDLPAQLGAIIDAIGPHAR